MIKKLCLFVILLSAFHQVFAVSTPIIIASNYAAAQARNNQRNDDSFMIKKFDYIVACQAKYRETHTGIYRYYCPHPPINDEIVMTSVTFNHDHWPYVIIYYMKKL